MTRITYLLLLAVVFTACKKPAEETAGGVVTEKIKAKIDSTLQAMVDAGKIGGASALIFEKDKEVYFNAFGKADSTKPFDRNTIVRIWSMTKPVTGVALMQLYEKGLFDLDDPISKYAPEFSNMMVYDTVDAKGKMVLKPLDRPITIRDLTRHTAGFARGEHPVLGKMVQEADLMNRETTLTQMAAKLSKLPLAFQPGEEWSYGVCVDVQAYLVEKISGKPFDQYIKENILTPLKMNETWYVPVDTNRLSAVYSKGEDGKLSRVPNANANAFNSKDWPLKPGGFGLTSTVDDYQRFARMLVNEGTFDGATILKPETVKLMATNHLSDTVTERMWLPSKGSVGFGIDFAVRLKPPVDEKEKRGEVGEFFWDGAASTLFWVDPKNELTAVLFVQIFPFSNELHKNFRDAVYADMKVGQ
jgi:CubicO group peptidase (beta-lactamase class C family)